MRDINRIQPFLKTLETVWNKVPDWRFRTINRKYKKEEIINKMFEE